MKKFLIAAAALAVAAAPLAASAQPFGRVDAGRYTQVVHNDGYRGANWDGRYNDGRGAAVAAGLFGFILGSALSNAQPYAERCDWETQRVIGPYGYVHYEQVQVCR
jgi:hypothetical protein